MVWSKQSMKKSFDLNNFKVCCCFLKAIWVYICNVQSFVVCLCTAGMNVCNSFRLCKMRISFPPLCKKWDWVGQLPCATTSTLPLFNVGFMKLSHFYVNKADLLKASMKIKGFFRFIFKKIALGHPLFFNGISSVYPSILLTMRLQFLFAIEKPLAEEYL